MFASLEQSLQTIPAGAWAIGVSGGADSVALLRACQSRSDLQLHVVHLNHELRGDDSDGDACFVADLAEQLRLPSTVCRRRDIEGRIASLPKNPSARYRRLRQYLFASVVRTHGLRGVLLGHHAGDQAETVLQRLIRGSGWAGLCGISGKTTISGICYYRPFLSVQSEMLRDYLYANAQPWREDASNASATYQRNCVRQLLRQKPELLSPLLQLAESARRLRSWMNAHAPVAAKTLDCNFILALPAIVRRWVIGVWLLKHFVPHHRIDPAVVERVIAMATDAATPSRVQLPGGLMLQRRRGTITAKLPLPSSMLKPPPASLSQAN